MIRPTAELRASLIAGSDQGGVHWGVIASLIETCKLNAIDPQAATTGGSRRAAPRSTTRSPG